MCRLLAYAAPRDTTVTKVIGDMNSDAFQRMTSVHNDGWGTAWLAAGFGETQREIESLRISTPGQNDPLLSTLLSDAPSNARIVHLRLATDDFKRTKVNTHPFVAEGLAFAHNGSIVPTWRFDDLLRPEIRATVAGDTDSELYFGLVRQNVRDGLSLEEAATAAVRVLRDEFPESSLNATILSADELVVVHASSTAHVTEATFARYGIDASTLPNGHTDEYYRLSMLRAADGTTVFSSTGIDTAGWTSVPEDTISRIDLASLDFTQRSLFSSAAEAGGTVGRAVGVAAPTLPRLVAV